MFKLLKAYLSPVFRVILDIVMVMLPVIKAVANSALRDFAGKAINEISLSTLTDSEKRSEAFKKIKGYAVANAIEVRDSVVNLLIEIIIVLKKVKA